MKSQPKYLQQFTSYPAANPIFITGEYSCLKVIHEFKGFCLYCENEPEQMDLSCCFQRDVWILCSSRRYWQRAVNLAHAAQQSGAAEIVIIKLG